ncbi:VOC family protein [Yersinia ruckeri]|uniref:VOC family protein n=1 Tax=Yersinia ruckeri TaxID=29486 RepID=UPI000BDF3AD1|nr:VOC family protein [Yersinia ruckeri]MCK8537842.1 VOC family protein [Yersinia ruckeri]MCK8570390.1 VOC family protein [Yersinia ruckeri]MCK8573300.1 VOC family protein [Yersinia ruckeri]MCK8577541.1 VOC family protein [Yersinia ruckeri]MCK8580519.1 VOC family protein [Yersinia ruckeri]
MNATVTDITRPLDLGLSHIALVVHNIDASLAFYQRYAGMILVHRRAGGKPGEEMAWMTDHSRPFAIVLVQSPVLKDTPLGPFGHIGIACASRAHVDELVALATAEGCLRSAPTDSGEPVGYWAYFADPDDNTLEVSYGQRIELTVTDSQNK